MIPASALHDNGDGTAWLACQPISARAENDAAWWRQRDRPCDTCSDEWFSYRCHACSGTGRHTFEIEVNTNEWSSVIQGTKVYIHRCSVVPGTVLPIVEEPWSGWCDPSVITLMRRADGDRGMIGNWKRITLPPAAAPGMWCVKLQVHS